MKPQSFFILLAALGVSSCKCDHLQEPEEPSTLINVQLSVDTLKLQYAGHELPTDTVSTWQLRYSLAAFDADAPDDSVTPIFNFSSLSPDFEIYLPAGEYRVFGWADYVCSDTAKSLYFHIDDLTDMLLKNKFSYQGTDTHKIAFSAEYLLMVSDDTPDVEMTLSPVMGQYRIQSTDTPDFSVSKIVVSYPAGVPASLNLLSHKICHLWQGVSFSPDTDLDSESPIYDNIFAEECGTDVTVKIEVYDDTGEVRARRNAITFPMYQGGLTLVRTNIYSTLEDDSTTGSSGGIGIDQSYDETTIIVIH